MPTVPVSAAAEHYEVSPQTIRNWIRTGVIQAERIGPKVLRVDLETLKPTAVIAKGDQ